MTIDAAFYQERVDQVKYGDPRKAVWDGTPEQYAAVRKESIEICREHVSPGMKVLDAGCGIGELTECLASGIDYLGIDFCAGFIEVAKTRYPNFEFGVCDLLDLSEFGNDAFDLAVCRTVEGVVSGQATDAWERIVNGLLRIAPKVLVFRARLMAGDTLKTVKIRGRE